MRNKDQYRRYRWFIDRAKNGKFPNAKKLADKFEIHKSSAQRALDEMRDFLDVPLEYDHSEKGFFLTDETYQIPGVWIKDEALFLFAMAKEVLKDKYSKQILNKFMEKIGSGHSSVEMEKIKNHIYFKSTGAYKLNEGILQKIMEGILKNRNIEITYIPVYEDKVPFTIQITPIYLLYYKINWYLLGKYKGNIRTYSLSRISEVRITDTEVDIEKYAEEVKKKIKEPFGIFLNNDEEMEEINIMFSKNMSKFAQKYLFHPHQKTTTNEDGTCNVSFRSFLSPDLISEILKFGNDVKVIKPKKLKQEIINKLKKSLKQY